MSAFLRWRGAAPAVVLLALALALGACGKKNSPRPPEGLESEFTYPRQYPAPLPGGTPVGLPAEAAAPSQPADDQQLRLQRPTEQRLSPFPIDYGQTKTRTYGSFPRTPSGTTTQ